MSGTSQPEHQAAADADAAAQSNASSPTFDKPDSCAKPSPSKKRSTPRTAVGLPTDSDRHYDLAELRACRFDAMAATVIHHVKYNTKRHKCPKAYTLPYWQSFFGGCSKQQARTAIKHAVAAEIDGVKLLEVTYGYFAKVWSPHYLYAPGVDFNTPSDVDFNTPSTEGNQQKETEEKVQEHSPVPGETPACPEIIQGEQGESKAKAEATPNPIPGVLEEYTAYEALKASPDFWRYELWTSLMVKHGHTVSTYVRPKRMKEYLSMLQRLDFRVTQHGEDTFESVLECMLEDWATWRCGFSNHGYDAPGHPTIAFLAKYTMRAYGWNTDAQARETTPEPAADVGEISVPADIPEPVAEAVVSAGDPGDETDMDEDRPRTQAEMDEALARWLPGAISTARAADEAEAQRKAARHLTAGVPMPSLSHKYPSKSGGVKVSGPVPCNVFQHGKGLKTGQITGKPSC